MIGEKDIFWTINRKVDSELKILLERKKDVCHKQEQLSTVVGDRVKNPLGFCFNHTACKPP